MPTFKAGDVVQLKSGGPSMTVYQTSDQDYVDCSWFDKNQDKAQRFQETSLKLAHDAQASYDASVKLFSKGSISIEDILEIFNVDTEAVRDRLRKPVSVNDDTFNEFVRAVYQSKYTVKDRFADNVDHVVSKDESHGFKVEVISVDSHERLDSDVHNKFTERLAFRLNDIKRIGYSHLETHMISGNFPAALIIYVLVH